MAKSGAFIDFGELERVADTYVAVARRHPLCDMQASQKMAYVGGLLFACRADDDVLQKEERKSVLEVACSLEMGDRECDELMDVIEGTPDRIAFLCEVVPTLKERRLFLFFLLDMIRVMTADGPLTPKACKLIDAVEKIGQASERDSAIISNYLKVLGKGKGWRTCAALNLGDVFGDGVECELFNWFISTADRADCLSKIKAYQSLALEEAVRVASRPLEDISCAKMWCGKGIPKSEKRLAHSALHVQESEHIVQIATGMGPFKSGAVITNRAFYYRNNVLSDPIRIPWDELGDCSINGCNIRLGDHGCFACVVGEERVAIELFHVLSSIVAKVREAHR